MSCGVLIIEDEQVLAKKIAKYLAMKSFDVRVANNGRDGLAEMARFFPEAILLDYNLPGDLNGLQVLDQVLKFDRGIKVILMTGQGNVRLAVDAIKGGAYDYVSKPVVLSELKLMIDKALRQSQHDGQLAYYQQREATQSGLDQIIGVSPAAADLKARIQRIIDATRGLQGGSPPSILINGETGVGKELVARALHYSGARADKPFVELNLAAIPAHLLESELFGYEKGAFTDARERKPGLVEAANGGTLFLDEIGELDLSAQVKLLKLLEDRSVRRIGSLRDYAVDIQVITATNRALQQLVQQGQFRQDLFYRLNTLNIPVPPLRERSGDAVLLAEHFVAQFSAKYNKPGLMLDPRAAVEISNYPWPGNVRELRNLMEQAVLHCDGRAILPVHIAFTPVSAAAPSAMVSPQAAGYAMPTMGADPSPGNTLVGEADGDDLLADAERQLIERTLGEVNGNISETARRLGITRDRLRYRLKKYGLGS
jgi:two-component system response regulator AtoC